MVVFEYASATNHHIETRMKTYTHMTRVRRYMYLSGRVWNYRPTKAKVITLTETSLDVTIKEAFSVSSRSILVVLHSSSNGLHVLVAAVKYPIHSFSC